jgi:hypothetical protein
VLQLSLDFARQQPLELNIPVSHPPMVGLRLHAGQEGRLLSTDARDLRNDSRVQKVHLIRKPGHCIKRPPTDYDAWLMGHVIFVPDPNEDVAAQCRDLCDKLAIRVG